MGEITPGLDLVYMNAIRNVYRPKIAPNNACEDCAHYHGPGERPHTYLCKSSPSKVGGWTYPYDPALCDKHEPLTLSKMVEMALKENDAIRD